MKGLLKQMKRRKALLTSDAMLSHACSMLQASAEIIEGMQQRDTDGAVVELSPLTSASGLAFAYVFMFLVGGARRRCQTLLDRNYWGSSSHAIPDQKKN
jgi:hypothetical protein